MYKRTIWQDHVEGIQEGTDLSAEHFNNLEAGTMDANALAALIAQYSRYEADIARNAEVVRVIVTRISNGDTIAIPEGKTRNDQVYNVIPVLVSVSDGTVGDVTITGRQLNGFRVQWNGTANKATFNFYISGGML